MPGAPERIYLRNENSFEESELVKDRHFCSLVDQLRRRIPAEKGAALLADVSDTVQPFFERYASFQESFGASAILIQRALSQNHYEEFKLHESPALKNRLTFEKARLETLSHLHAIEISRDHVTSYSNYTSIAIQICAILHAIQCVHSWGWEHQQPI